jgi:hypothetical protein
LAVVDYEVVVVVDGDDEVVDLAIVHEPYSGRHIRLRAKRERNRPRYFVD